MDKLKMIIKERKFKYIYVFWFIIAAQFVIGHSLEVQGYSISNFSDFLIKSINIIILATSFTFIHYSILSIYNKIKKESTLKVTKNKYRFIIYFFIIIICWIPALLAFFPIIPNYDGPYQIMDCNTGSIGTRHPILHSLLLNLFYKVGYNYFGSYNNGMLLLSIFQMTVMALIFSYSVKFVYDQTNKKWIRNLSILFYAIFPYNQLFPLMTTKDSLFGAFLLLFVIRMYKFVTKEPTIKDFIFLIITCLLVLFFRNNALYALILFLPFAIICLFKNSKKVLNILCVFMLSIFIYMTCNTLLISSLNAIVDGSQEKYSLFSQAAAKIYKERKNDLEYDEIEKLAKFFNGHEQIGDLYVTYLADNTKLLLDSNNIDNNKMEFLEFTLHLLVKYPREFIDSFLNTSRGYWYICDNSFNQVYHDSHPDTMGALELTFFDFVKENCKLVPDSKLPKLQMFYRNLICGNEYRKIPIIYVIFQPAIYFYAVIAFMLYSLYSKDHSKLLIGMLLFCYFLTCYFGPVAIIRYMYGVMVCTPVLLGLSLNRFDENTNHPD